MATADNFLTRKLSRAGVARSPLPDTELIGEAMARQLEDHLRPVVKCAISATPLEIRVVKLFDVVREISVPSMLGVVEVQDADTTGLLCIDPELAYHLVDLTLGGDASSAPPPPTRAFTSIDFALGKLHLEAILEAFREALGSGLGKPISKRMTLGEQPQNISQLRLAPVDVLAFSISLDIGEAARTGKLSLLMPLATLDVIRASVTDVQDARRRPDDLWRIQMRRAAAASPVVVDAVLHRRTFTVAAIQRLRPGDVIELPPSAPDEIQLTIQQPAGKTATIGTARLGSYKNAKVVKLDATLDPRVRQHLKIAL